MKKLSFSLALLIAGIGYAWGDTFTVSTSQTGGGITHTNQAYTDGQTIEADASTTFNATPVTGYVPMVTVIDHTIYVDYFSTTTTYYIRHSTSATNHKGYYMAAYYQTSGKPNGISIQETANNNCKFSILPINGQRNKCYIKTCTLAGAQRYVYAYASDNAVIGYGSTATPYTIERMPDGTFVLYASNSTADHRYLHNNSSVNVVGYTKDSPDSHWFITDGTTFTTTATFTAENGTTFTSSTTDNIPNTSFVGLECATLSNVSIVRNAEGGINYTADIAFPFPLSTATEKHHSYFGLEPSGIHMHLFTNTGTTSTGQPDLNVYAYNPSSAAANKPLATNGPGDQARFKWAFIPHIDGQMVTFTIYNEAKGMYLKAASTAATSTDKITVSLTSAADEATPFLFAETNVTNGNGTGFRLIADDHFLSCPGSGVNVRQTLEMLKKSAHAAHKGFNADFEPLDDFEALMAALRARREMDTALEALIGTGVNHYTAPSGYANMKTLVDQVLADGSTTYFTGAQFTQAMAGLLLTLNNPTEGFYRFKAAATNRYLSVGTPGSTLASSENADASTIIYYTGQHSGSANIYSYDKGYYLNQDKVSALGQGGNQYLFATAPDICYRPVEGSDEAVPAQYAFDYYGSVYILDKGNDGVLESTTTPDRMMGWLLEPVSELPLTIGASGYTTFSCPMATELPTGWTAYAVTEIGDDAVRIEELTGIIPANTGIIINGTGEDVMTVTTGGTAPGANSLLPNNIVALHAANAGHYFLATLDGQTGFYRNAADGYLTGHKAYLAPSASVKAFLGFETGTATALDALLAPNAPVEIYDLNGRRLPRLAKGVNIVGGKKIIVK